MNPFLNIFPKLDVHGFTSDSVIFPVSDFINDNLKLGNNKIVIVHGLGKGILKNTIRNHFGKDQRVKKIYGDSFNLGITIIELNK